MSVHNSSKRSVRTTWTPASSQAPIAARRYSSMTELVRSPSPVSRSSTTPGGATYTQPWGEWEARHIETRRTNSVTGTCFDGAASFVPTDRTTASESRTPTATACPNRSREEAPPAAALCTSPGNPASARRSRATWLSPMNTVRTGITVEEGPPAPDTHALRTEIACVAASGAAAMSGGTPPTCAP